MEFASIPWVQGSMVAVALAVVFSAVGMVFKGLLIPRPNHELIVAVIDARLAEKAVEAENYKAAWLAEQTARREQDAQLSELLEFARTTDQVLKALGRRGGRDALAP